MNLVTSVLLLLIIADVCICATSAQLTCLYQYNTFFDIAFSSDTVVMVGMCGDGEGSQLIYRAPLPRSGTAVVWSREKSMTWHNVDLLSGVEFANGAWIASGGVAAILSSSDAESWSLVPNSVENDFFHYVRYAGDLWFIGGSFGRILVSKDAKSWTVVQNKSADGQEMYAVAFSDSVYVAVGGSDGTDGPIVVSHDGYHWIAADGIRPSIDAYLLDVTAVSSAKAAVSSVPATAFLAAGTFSDPPGAENDHALVISSSDGYGWTALYKGKLGTKLNSVAIYQSTIVAVGTIVVVSYDLGHTWTEIAHLPSKLGDVEFLSAVRVLVTASKEVQWLAVGSDNRVWLSTDAATWTDIAPKF